MTIKKKFLNQIYIPALELVKDFSRLPILMEPNSNTMLHKFEGLAIHLNHFCEKNAFTNFRHDDIFRKMCNSIKHSRVDVELQSSVLFEYKEDSFRFLRNTVSAKFVDSGVKFDALDLLCDTTNKHIHLLNLDLMNISPAESVFNYFRYAFVYHLDGISVETNNCNIQFVVNRGGSYEPYSPSEVRFCVLGKEHVGLNPIPLFP